MACIREDQVQNTREREDQGGRGKDKGGKVMKGRLEWED